MKNDPSSALFDRLTEILDPEPHDPALNMALDEALLARAREPLLRIYAWIGAPVSFGCFGRRLEIAARWPGRPLIRRWTGGGEVPHGADLTYTLIVPHPHPFASLSPAVSYRRIHECIASLLPGAVLAERPRVPPSGACFENAAESDVLVHDSKAAGAAQRRTRRGLLHQGSIQMAAALPPSLRRELPRAFASSVSHREFTAGERAMAADLAAEKYGTSEWLERW